MNAEELTGLVKSCFAPEEGIEPSSFSLTARHITKSYATLGDPRTLSYDRTKVCWGDLGDGKYEATEC